MHPSLCSCRYYASQAKRPTMMRLCYLMAGILLLLDGSSVSAIPQARSEPKVRRSLLADRNEKYSLHQLVKPEIEILSEYSKPQSLLDKARRPPKIIIMGGPASGKGTQCKLIASKYNLVHLSTGDMLREALQQQPHLEAVKVAKQHMDAGKLVPDDIVIQIVMDRIQKPDCRQQGWLLDGFPRTLAQAEAMSRIGVEVDAFFFLRVPDQVLIERVVGRRIDPVSGTIYHLSFFPPPTQSIRDRLLQRDDDTVDKISCRLQQFRKNAAGIRKYYEDILYEIDGTGTPETVSSYIQKAIGDRRILESMGEV